jgi:ribosomal protein L16 Arg81 hydroxylase
MTYKYISKPSDNSPELLSFFKMVVENPNIVLHLPKAVKWNVYGWNDFNRYFNTYASTNNFKIIENNYEIEVPKQSDVNNWETLNKIDTKQCYKILNKPNTGFVVTQGVDKHNPFITNMCANLEMIFNGVCGTHLYGGASTTHYNSSFKVHCDKTLNVILQLDGESKWTVYNEKGEEPMTENDESKLTPVYEEVLHPGDLLYIPALRFHKCVPRSRRLSLSFCCVPDIGQKVREIHAL